MHSYVKLLKNLSSLQRTRSVVRFMDCGNKRNKTVNARVRHSRHRFAAWKDVVDIPNFIELWFVAVSKLYVCKRRRVRFSHYYFGDSRNVHSPAGGLNVWLKPTNAGRGKKILRVKCALSAADVNISRELVTF